LKYIPLTEKDGLKTSEIVEAVLRYGGKEGIAFEQMRQRSRIWDALDANKDPCGLLLEDADAALLIDLVKRFPFANASREVVRMVEAITEAKAPPAPLAQAPEPKKAKGNGKHAEAVRPEPPGLA
jgi:hypothetical protein